MDYKRVVVDNLPLVDSVVRFIARRHRLSTDEQDELGAQIRLKLVDNDYEVLRRFQSRSSLRTYLTTVVQRHFLDSRIAKWGKYRPSAQARRLGPLAVLLDQLVSRDGLSFDEAVSVIQSKHGDVSRSHLVELFEQLPERHRRRVLGEEALEQAPEPATANPPVDLVETAREADRIERALAAALGTLEPQDRLILQLRYCDGVKIARIAELLDLPQKPLYRRFEDVEDVLRHELEARGVSQAAVLDIIGRPESGLGDVLVKQPTRNAPRSPSLL